MASYTMRDRLQSGADASTSQRLASLRQQFPCREQAVDQLAAELSRGSRPGTACFVYGPPATGKTAVVRWGQPAGGVGPVALQRRILHPDMHALAVPTPLRPLVVRLGHRPLHPCDPPPRLASPASLARRPPPYPARPAARRGLLSALRLPHAYVNCNEHGARPRSLLASVLHQLKGGKRQREDGYDTALKCDSLADFRLQLPGELS